MAECLLPWLCATLLDVDVSSVVCFVFGFCQNTVVFYRLFDVSLIMRGRLYSICVRSSMLHGSESWPVRKENVVALQRAEMRMVRWMCGVKLKDRLPSKELRERLGVDDIALILQQNRLRWYGHVLRKDDDDWVKKCMEYEVEDSRTRGRPKRTWKEVVQEDCQARKLNKEDAMNHCKWRKVIKEAR